MKRTHRKKGGKSQPKYDFTKYKLQKKKLPSKEITTEISLSENNRIIYAFKRIRKSHIIEVTTVSLDIKIGTKWKTVLYYDCIQSHQKKLHRHRRISLDIPGEIPFEKEINIKGAPKKKLTWAIRDIKKNWIDYKKKLLERSKKTKKKLDIELF